MRDPNAGKYIRQFAAEFAMAELVLAPYGKLEWSKNDYEAFRFVGDDVTLIFYPHKTRASNVHIRVREQGSRDKDKARELMALLDIGSGANCTFSRNHQNGNDIMYQEKLRKRLGLAYGWAALKVREVEQ